MKEWLIRVFIVVGTGFLVAASTFLFIGCSSFQVKNYTDVKNLNEYWNNIVFLAKVSEKEPKIYAPIITEVVKNRNDYKKELRCIRDTFGGTVIDYEDLKKMNNYTRCLKERK